MSKTFLYFAYGSNLLSKRIHINNPSAVRVGTGKLHNYRLDFNRFSKRWHGCSATIVPHQGYHVWGALWEINFKDLPHLDRQEGVHSNIYFRLEVDVELPNGQLQRCFVYEQCDNPKEHIKFTAFPKERRPSQVYLNTILVGARESQLPDEYQTILQKIPHNGFNENVDLSLQLNIQE